MFKRILVAFDGSAGSDQALNQALALAQMAGAAVTALSVEEKLPAYAASVGEVEETKLEMDAYFARVQAGAVECAAAVGVRVETVVRAGRAAQVIVRYADEGDFDLIVIGADASSGLGGTADRVAENAHCSVLFARSAFQRLHVRDVMSRSVATVELQTSLAEVVELLIRRQLKAVPVIDKGYVAGIITGGDLMRRADMGLRLSVQRTLPAELLAEQLRELAGQGKTAGEIMTSPVFTIHDDVRLPEAVSLMAHKRVKRLPVVDGQGKLVGMLSRLDVLATVASAARSGDVLPAVSSASPSVASDIMFRDVPTVGPGTRLSETLNKLLATPLRRIVVVDEARRVLGIIVDANLLAQAGLHQDAGALGSLLNRLARPASESPALKGTAADVMAKQVFTVHEDTPLHEVLQLMLERRVKRLVVIDAAGRLAGMVDRSSLLNAIASLVQEG